MKALPLDKGQGPSRPPQPYGREDLTRFFAEDIATFESYKAKLAPKAKRTAKATKW